MRGDGAAYELLTPASLDEALALLADGARPFAGGTDLMVQLSAGRLPGRRYVNLWPLDDLRGVEVTPDEVRIGALTTYRELQRHPLLGAEFPLLLQAAAETGGVAIQARGTLGGNLANASPAADSPPALLAYGAELTLRSGAGARRLPYTAFHLGYKQTALRPGELIAALHLPRPQGPRVALYRKVGPRLAQAISKVCFAGCAELDGARVTAVRLGLGGVAPTVAAAPGAAAALAERDLFDDGSEGGAAAAQRALQSDIAPIDDLRSSAAYRRQVAANLLGAFVAALRAGVRAGAGDRAGDRG